MSRRRRRAADTLLDGRVRIERAHWLLHYRAHRGLAPHFRVGRMLLAGDAGHVHPPAGGQGMNTGIQDAINAAWRLALVVGSHADPDLLDDYDRERHAVAAEIVSGTSKLATLMSGTGLTAVARQATLFLLGHVHALNDLVATRAAQLGIGYSDSDTVLGPTDRVGRHVGEHASTVPALRRNTGTGVPALARPEHAVLVFGGRPDELAQLAGLFADVGSVVDVDREVDDAAELAAAFGLQGRGIVAIRPDGYVGLVADDLDAATVEDYLTRCLRRRPALPRA